MLRIQFEVEGAVEGWGSLDVEVRAAIPHGVSVVLNTLDFQIPKIRELTNEIENLLVIASRAFQFQRLQGLQKPPEVFLHLWNKRGDVQPTSLEASEIREGTEVLDAG